MSLLQMQQKGLTVNSAEPGTELSTLVPSSWAFSPQDCKEMDAYDLVTQPA